MMKRCLLTLIAGITLLWSFNAYSQQVQCCTFNVRHNFRICLPQCQIVGVDWSWFAQATAWPPLTVNTNSGNQFYPVPSSDSKCASVVVGQDCAFATACTSFSVSPVPGTPCIQGYHESRGRACARCRLYGSHATAFSHITIQCGGVAADGTIQWQPAFQDSVGGSCGVQVVDPVVAKLRHRETGRRSEVVLFDLRASGTTWETQDLDADGWGDVARIKGSNRPPRGHITLLKQRMAGGGGDSRLHLAFDNGVVTESEATGEFSDISLPGVGEPMPDAIEVPPSIRLEVETPDGWVLESIEMGGGGDAGQQPPIPGDVNGDGCVDDADLLAVLFAFGGIGTSGEDINNDGVVDDADLLIVLFNFGEGC